MLKKIGFSFFVFVSLSTFALDPRLDYEKMESEHFHVIFDAKSYDEAKKYIQEAERSHKLLTKVFGAEPSFTVVLLEPNIDLANGAATGVPRPTIFVHLQPPTALSSVNYFSDWPQDVFLHEYAHILNMEPANGVFAPLRWIFGSFVRPNMYLPRWYLEGLAVEMESRFNETGRLKSEDYDALIRALLLDGQWGTESLSQINETTTPTWPQGQRPYFYGALIWHEIYQQKGPAVVKRLNERYGGRFPYFISAPIEDEMGKDYSGILQDIYSKYRNLALVQIEALKKEKLTNGKKIVIQDAIFQHSPVVSPNGDLLTFVSADNDGDSFIYLLRREGKEFSFNSGTRLRNLSKEEIQKISWFPSSDKIVFDALDTWDRVKQVFDLYTYDIENSKVERLTSGERAREPAVSPDGKTVVYIKADRGNTSLYRLDVATKKTTLLLKPSAGIRLSRPSYVNAHTIVFAQKKLNGSDQIQLFDIPKKQIVKSFTDLATSSEPTVVDNGIVFTSVESGVENLYWTDFNMNHFKPLTNTLTRIINGTLDSKNKMLYYADLTGEGVFLKKASVQDLKTLPRVKHPIKGDFEKVTKETSTVAIPERESYWAIRYMFPQYWIPFVSATEDGTLTSITIPGSDARGHHIYAIQGSYDSRPGEWSGALTYGWINSLGATTFSVSDVYTYYNSLDRTTNDKGAKFLHAFPIYGLSNNFSALAGFKYEQINIATSSTTDENHYFKGPTVGFGYSNLEQKLNEIAPKGQSYNIQFTKFLKNNTDTQYNKTAVFLQHNQSKWLPRRHRLTMSATGVHSEKNRSILLGTTSSDTPVVFGPAIEGFYLRGYPPGEFIGYSMALGKLEYKFPLADVYSGPDSPIPIFIKRLHGEVFAEAMTLRGIYFEKSTELAKRTDLGTFYSSMGGELKIDMTLMYHLPVTLVNGVAYGFSSESQGEVRFYTLLQSPLLF